VQRVYLPFSSTSALSECSAKGADRSFRLFFLVSYRRARASMQFVHFNAFVPDRSYCVRSTCPFFFFFVIFCAGATYRDTTWPRGRLQFSAYSFSPAFYVFTRATLLSVGLLGVNWCFQSVLVLVFCAAFHLTGAGRAPLDSAHGST